MHHRFLTVSAACLFLGLLGWTARGDARDAVPPGDQAKQAGDRSAQQVAIDVDATLKQADTLRDQGHPAQAEALYRRLAGAG